MFRHDCSIWIYCLVLCCSALPSLVFNSVALGGEPAVKFDVPSLVGVRELVLEGIHVPSSSQKTIEVVVPVSSEVRAADRSNLQEFRFDVFWNRNSYPICDYGPKTRTFSEIAGPISIEKSTEKKATLGLNLSGGYETVVKAEGKSELGNSEKTKRSYDEIPQHEILVASGTTRRGTGAFFRFHPSRTETLEGGRDLVVVFQVPQSWRGGVLQIECQAVGNRKMLAWSEPFEINRAFILPIYLEGDDQAREAATEFVRSEQRLRSDWLKHQSRSRSGTNSTFQTMFASGTSRKIWTSNLPADWVHYLIQSSDDYLDRYRDRLSNEVADAAGQFVKARSQLLEMSR